ncbi:phenylalanine--tRNA ligase subunit beta [Halieaceae bacterium IMCC14734]|uniref:Phenylalanine--tRNA ligase beta subunit n=1 Tax=Candidatus Litorirhabdus singularis TaxID=2518993 RepID=A0ABT3TFV8_9GAMM|nr:phenylalanine--tRNA ligase subunit beta [Candidatus Litorirhabdus singularis]MCX2981193.1 phenylalanine--tRNA ligase subunit beta [Candidatus Litorirhabdus singularis]
MKISEQWLKEWVDPGLPTDELAHLITMGGLEVDGVEPVAGEFSGVIVAEITAAEQHPNADKLRVCQVNTGTETVQIVCGAPNARVGLRAPLARVGAVLPGDFKIAAAKLRDVESQGMLCAEQELGLSDANDGLMELAANAPVGTDLRDYLQLEDQVIEVDLTPNRADCLGLLGIAREVGVLTNRPVKSLEIQEVKSTILDVFDVQIEAPTGCARYLGRVIKGVDISRPSPLWMQERLRRAGLRSIDAVVDVTNYVLLELGQPMHAFDLSKLEGAIVVREAGVDESLELLNGQTAELTPGTLLITDASGPVAIAGIMGGQPTAVSDNTVDIMLEAAFFQPLALAGKARSYGLHTDSSHRFERGVDFELQHRAMERATQLLVDAVGGSVGPITETVADAHLPVRAAVLLRRMRIEKLLGFALEDAEVERILNGLGLATSAVDGGWSVAVPSWRFDISIEADLLEELARVYGYNNLPVTHIHSDLVIRPLPERVQSLRNIRRRLTGRGYREAVTYSFVDPAGQALFDPQLEPVALANPISAEMSVMRTSLLPGLMESLKRNTSRQQQRVRLFETGLRFVPDGGELTQAPTIAGVVTGRLHPESWSEEGEAVDFYDTKGDVEALLQLTAEPQAFRFTAATRTGLHPGQTAALYRGEALVGYIGALHPSVQASYDVSTPVYVFELDLGLLRGAAMPAFAELSRYPEVRRDIAVLVDREVPAAELLENVRTVAGTYLTDLRLFDVYEGKGIDPKRKSLALGLTYRDSSRTLSDEDVNKSVDQVIDLLRKTYNAELRN